MIVPAAIIRDEAGVEAVDPGCRENLGGLSCCIRLYDVSHECGFEDIEVVGYSLPAHLAVAREASGLEDTATGAQNQLKQSLE